MRKLRCTLSAGWELTSGFPWSKDIPVLRWENWGWSVAKHALASQQGPPFIKQADRQTNHKKQELQHLGNRTYDTGLRPQGPYWTPSSREGWQAVSGIWDVGPKQERGAGADSRDSLLLGLESSLTLAGGPWLGELDAGSVGNLSLWPREQAFSLIELSVLKWQLICQLSFCSFCLIMFSSRGLTKSM